MRKKRRKTQKTSKFTPLFEAVAITIFVYSVVRLWKLQSRMKAYHPLDVYIRMLDYHLKTSSPSYGKACVPDDYVEVIKYKYLEQQYNVRVSGASTEGYSLITVWKANRQVQTLG